MKLEDKRILVTGSSGLVGHHLVNELTARGAKHLICPRSKDFDLRKAGDVEVLFRDAKPDIVFSLAAKVGGILDNKRFPADFYFENILIGAYIYDACARHKVGKLVSAGAGCGYPLTLKEPLREEEFFDGFPQKESAPYSLAKKMLVIQGVAYRQQYGLESITLIPSNLYGEHDNFNLEQAHVIPALVRKFYEAVREGRNRVEVWGNGTAKRDFIHCADVARIMVEATLRYNDPLPLNLCYGEQHSVRDVVTLLSDISGFNGEIYWDLDKPSGQNSRKMSTENFNKHLPGVKPDIDLRAGLTRTYRWLADNYANARL